MKNPGQQLQDIIRRVDSGPGTEPSVRLCARAAGRFLEEAVELGYEFGLTPLQIMGHVMDAIHNETRKAEKYPSEMSNPGHRSDQLVELADVSILVDYIRHIRGIAPEEVDDAIQGKVGKLSQLAFAGEMKVIDGLMYRKASRP